ncbi:uncharacterized protein VTP21DRAFT_10759 [Calcarisporiella thermophila]|uniref:uncharacterized protein n=1 Tax=Calcarisporiella thermophila TaxID=911321 RepID=UPI0037444AFD
MSAPQRKKTNLNQLSEAKLKRIAEHTQRLQEYLELPRIRVSEASESLIKYCNSTRDPLVPSIWGPVDKREDPFSPQREGCCVVL